MLPLVLHVVCRLLFLFSLAGMGVSACFRLLGCVLFLVLSAWRVVVVVVVVMAVVVGVLCSVIVCVRFAGRAVVACQCLLVCVSALSGSSPWPFSQVLLPSGGLAL